MHKIIPNTRIRIFIMVVNVCDPIFTNIPGYMLAINTVKNETIIRNTCNVLYFEFIVLLAQHIHIPQPIASKYILNIKYSCFDKDISLLFLNINNAVKIMILNNTYVIFEVFIPI